MSDRTNVGADVQASKMHLKNWTATSYLTRRETFSSSHRLQTAALTASENADKWGQCSRRHGHNYVLHATYARAYSACEGTVQNASRIKAELRAVLDEFDHRDLDTDVAEFAHGLPSTVENLACVIWQRLVGRLEGLEEIRLEETENVSVVFRGEFGGVANGAVG